MATHRTVTTVRFCVRFHDAVLRVCKAAFSGQDGSIYLFRYGARGEYHFGRSSIPAGQQEATVPFDQQEASDSTPKLSFHESGQVHVKAGGMMVGPMFASPLAELRG